MINYRSGRLGYRFLNTPFNIAWNTTTTGLVAGPGGWVITDGGLTIRYNVQNSANCGGPNPNIQTGTASGTITTGIKSYNFIPSLIGFGEAEDPGYENMDLYLSGGVYGALAGAGTLLTRSTSAGGSLGCVTATPVVQTNIVPPPYLLQASTTYRFRLNFSTTDELFHVNAYYQCNLTFVTL
jgi:hypothetical protein